MRTHREEIELAPMMDPFYFSDTPARFESTITNKERSKRKKAKKQQKLSRRINRLTAK